MKLARAIYFSGPLILINSDAKESRLTYEHLYFISIEKIFLGKGGEKIKELRSTTGADINICSNPMPGSDER